MNDHQLRNRAAQAVASLEKARSPYERDIATREGLEVKVAVRAAEQRRHVEGRTSPVFYGAARAEADHGAGRDA